MEECGNHWTNRHFHSGVRLPWSPPVATAAKGAGSERSRRRSLELVQSAGRRPPLTPQQVLAQRKSAFQQAAGAVPLTQENVYLLDRFGITRQTATMNPQVVLWIAFGVAAVTLLVASEGAAGQAEDELATKAASVEGTVEASQTLPESIAQTFENGQYKVTKLPSPITVYRVEGGTSYNFGRWFGAENPVNAAQAEQMYNVAEYGNELNYVQEYKIPAGTTVYEGRVAGGTAYQYYISNPNAAGVTLVGGPEYLPYPGH